MLSPLKGTATPPLLWNVFVDFRTPGYVIEFIPVYACFLPRPVLQLAPWSPVFFDGSRSRPSPLLPRVCEFRGQDSFGSIFRLLALRTPTFGLTGVCGLVTFATCMGSPFSADPSMSFVAIHTLVFPPQNAYWRQCPMLAAVPVASSGCLRRDRSEVLPWSSPPCIFSSAEILLAVQRPPSLVSPIISTPLLRQPRAPIVAPQLRGFVFVANVFYPQLIARASALGRPFFFGLVFRLWLRAATSHR